MFEKPLKIALTEVKMSCRGWRLWLLLFLISGLSLFARNDFIKYLGNGFYLHSAYSFQHPSFWLMTAVSLLGAASLALDAVARIRKTGMDKIIFPLPVGSFQLYLGLYLGVLFLIIPLSAFGIFSLAIWQEIYGHAAVVWQPYIIAYLYMILPILMPLVALIFALRTILKNDFASLLLTTAVIGVIGYYREELGIFIDFSHIANLLMNASPNLGVLINHVHYWIPLTVHLLLSLVLLSIAPLYLRRQTPQDIIITRKRGVQVFGYKTLLQLLTKTRFDKHLGWGTKLAFTLSLILVSAGAITAAYHFQDYNQRTHNNVVYERLLNTQQIENPSIDLIRSRVSINPDEVYSKLSFSAQLDFDVLQTSDLLNFELEPRYIVEQIFLNEKPIEFTQNGKLVQLKTDNKLIEGEENSLRFIYQGTPKNLHANYSALLNVWLPIPWHESRARHQEKWLDTGADYFEGSIELHLKPWQKGAFAGRLVNLEEDENKRVEHWQTFTDVNNMELHWGLYDAYEVEKDGYVVKFFHLLNHGYQAAVYVEEVKEQEEYVREKLGALPFPQLTILETPYHFPTENFAFSRLNNSENQHLDYALASDVSEMPGVIKIRENRVGYLHENMWTLERFDHNPFEIPFYGQIQEVLERIHDQFYNRLISVYFDHSLQPAGEYSFWLKNHLSSYASSLLNRNPWQRRQELNYDIGTGPELPISVAQRDNLLDLYNNGSYPQLLNRRGEGLFRMIHHLLGDETWWSMMQTMFHDYRFREITADDFIALAESFYGDSLDWFKEQWIYGTVLPEYEITQAEARMIEDPRNMSVDYQLAIKVKNHGTGRMAVPIFIETEMDYIFRNIWLDSGEEGVMNLLVPHRPIFTIVDPERWIVQEPYYDAERNRRSHSESRIYIEGDQRDRGGVVRRRERHRGRW